MGAALNGRDFNIGLKRGDEMGIWCVTHRTEENENFNRALSVRRSSSSLSLALNAVYISSPYFSPSCGG